MVCFVHGYVAALVFMFPLYNGQWEGDCPEVKEWPLFRPTLRQVQGH